MRYAPMYSSKIAVSKCRVKKEKFAIFYRGRNRGVLEQFHL